jgi:hypothetical protein
MNSLARLRPVLALMSVSAVCIACLPVQQPPAGRAMAEFVDDYFDALFTWSPTSATAWGNHDHDASIEDLSAAAYSHQGGPPDSPARRQEPDLVSRPSVRD